MEWKKLPPELEKSKLLNYNKVRIKNLSINNN